MTDTYSEDWRHHTEIKLLVEWAKQDPARAKRYLELVAQRRGEAASRRLAEGARAMWRQEKAA